MKFFTLPALLAAALFCAVVVLPFQPWGKARPLFFALETRLASTAGGVVKIYYDVGQGFSESDSTQHALIKTDIPQLYRFALPPGNYRALRFDPIDDAGTVTVVGPVRIVSETGREVRPILLSELKPLQQIDSVAEREGRLEIVTSPKMEDPQLGLGFSPPLELAIRPYEYVMAALRPFAVVFGLFALALFALDRSPQTRPKARHALGWLQRHPRQAIAIVAAAAVVASAYPVVFLGKSHVSPNFATTLLYGGYPSLPGYTSSVTASGNGSDMGAMMWQNVPYAFMQRRALAGGELPLWNRYNSTGAPLLAQGQSMFGDPLHFLVLLFDGASWAWDLKFLLAKWLLATGLGLSVLVLGAARPSHPFIPAMDAGSAAADWLGEARPGHSSVSASAAAASGAAAYSRGGDGGTATPPSGIDLTRWLGAAAVVACVVPFIGFFHYRINHAAIFSLSYAPWVLYCWLRLAQVSGRRPITLWATGLFVANLALMNSGTVKEAYLLMAQMNLAGAGLLLAFRQGWRARLAQLAAATWAGALLLLITAPIWATFLQTLRHAFTVSTKPTASQLQPAFLLGAFDELFFRPLSPINIAFDPSLNFVLLLGFLYFLATLRLHFRHRVMMALALATAATLAFAFGVVPARWIVQVPLLANVGHIENCFLCGFIVLGSLIAGVGLATAAARLRAPEGRGDLAIAGALLGALIFAWIGAGQAAHRDITPGTAFFGPALGQALPVSGFIWASLASFLVASVGLAVITRRGTRGPTAAILASLCGLVLLWRHGLHVGAVGFEPYAVHPPARASFHVASPAIEFVQARHRAEPARVFGLHGNLTPGWNAVYGLEATQGPDALQNPWVRELIEASPLTWNSTWQLYSSSKDADKARPFLDALNVGFYLDLKRNHASFARPLHLACQADLDVYESPTVWPRAFFTSRLDSHRDPAELMAKFFATSSRPFASLPTDQVAQPALRHLARPSQGDSVAPATGYRLTENSTSFNVHASEAGIVVLTEAWWPDSFRATVDGRRVPILRVNHAFKGVLIEAPGDHRVEFWYWPRGFLRNLELSGGGLALLAVSLFFGLRPAPVRAA